MDKVIENLNRDGFAVVPKIFTHNEVEKLKTAIDKSPLSSIFGERSFLLNHPAIVDLLKTQKFMQLLEKLCPNKQLSKAIYFDKPPQANWAVPWHQDLMINVIEKREAKGFTHWRQKRENFVVQPPLEILESTTTFRIHLDDCTEENEALRCIKGSHQQGIISMSNWQHNAKESICSASEGSIVLMRPLTLHASHRTENTAPRRVIHLEFCEAELPNAIMWHEGMTL